MHCHQCVSTAQGDARTTLIKDHPDERSWFCFRSFFSPETILSHFPVNRQLTMGQDLFCCSFIVVPLYSVVQVVVQKQAMHQGRIFWTFLHKCVCVVCECVCACVRACVRACVCVCPFWHMSFNPFAPFILWLSIFHRERERENSRILELN